MPDDLAFDHIDHQLGDIRGVIGDTFKRFADEGEANGTRNRCGIFDHDDWGLTAMVNASKAIGNS